MASSRSSKSPHESGGRSGRASPTGRGGDYSVDGKNKGQLISYHPCGKKRCGLGDARGTGKGKGKSGKGYDAHLQDFSSTGESKFNKSYQHTLSGQGYNELQGHVSRSDAYRSAGRNSPKQSLMDHVEGDSLPRMVGPESHSGSCNNSTCLCSKKQSPSGRSYGPSDGYSYGPTDYYRHDPTQSRSHGSSDIRSHGPSSARSHGPSDVRSHGPSSARSLGPSDVRRHGPASARSHGPSDLGSYGSKGQRFEFQPDNYEAGGKGDGSDLDRQNTRGANALTMELNKASWGLCKAAAIFLVGVYLTTRMHNVANLIG